MLNLYTIGVPLLLTTFIIESLLTLAHNAEKSLLKDMLANLFIAFCTMLSGLTMKGVAFAFYSLVYSVSFFTPDVSWKLWVLSFFFCDFIHYFYHWLGHKTRLFWAGHVTHHSSLYYNFSVALRNNSFHLFYRFIFWTPLCLFGIPAEMILFFGSLTEIWNFLLHTEKIKKLGLLDWIFNTPSNHRVHHASNPEYIDKNLGGILMIYDHLFRTYKKETIPPVYGITHNIYTHNPFNILLHEYIQLSRDVSTIRGLKSRIRFLLSCPQGNNPERILCDPGKRKTNENK